MCPVFFVLFLAVTTHSLPLPNPGEEDPNLQSPNGLSLFPTNRVLRSADWDEEFDSAGDSDQDNFSVEHKRSPRRRGYGEEEFCCRGVVENKRSPNVLGRPGNAALKICATVRNASAHRKYMYQQDRGKENAGLMKTK